MKTAQLTDGNKIEAEEGAPLRAVCAFCGGPVSLRRRKLMNNSGFAYFWRHEPGTDPACPGRSSPLRRGGEKGK